MFWGKWSDYPKVIVDGREYAQIGERLYTRHAVDYFQPSGRRTIGNVPVAQGEGGGYLTDGRGVPPRFVEETIVHGATRLQIVNGVCRTVHALGDLEVVTEQAGRIVVTVSYRH